VSRAAAGRSRSTSARPAISSPNPANCWSPRPTRRRSPRATCSPEEIDVALAIERLQERTTIRVAHVERKWAGLRSFAADKTPVVGFDPLAPGFFWLAGQGGYGIQAAEGLARGAAGLIETGALPEDIADAGLDPAALSPARFRP
jgi:D-arginine dehydrogenase